MPELPEVETIARGLKPLLEGRQVRRTWLRHATLYRTGSQRLPHLVGRRFAWVGRKGKNVLFRFKPAGLMILNLGMTGSPVVVKADEDHGIHHAKHLHARIGLSGGYELRYYDPRRFGHFYIADDVDFRSDLNIGPDPFEADVAYLQANLSGRSAPIKALLLDQRVLSGIGNIYADETLFWSEIDPRTPGDKVAGKSARVLQHARDVLTRAIDHGGSTLRDYRQQDGKPGMFQIHHAVYGREGEACIECGTELEKITLGGRGTHFCPNCQR